MYNHKLVSRLYLPLFSFMKFRIVVGINIIVLWVAIAPVLDNLYRQLSYNFYLRNSISDLVHLIADMSPS